MNKDCPYCGRKCPSKNSYAAHFAACPIRAKTLKDSGYYYDETEQAMYRDILEYIDIYGEQAGWPRVKQVCRMALKGDDPRDVMRGERRRGSETHYVMGVMEDDALARQVMIKGHTSMMDAINAYRDAVIAKLKGM